MYFVNPWTPVLKPLFWSPDCCHVATIPCELSMVIQHILQHILHPCQILAILWLQCLSTSYIKIFNSFYLLLSIPGALPPWTPSWVLWPPDRSTHCLTSLMTMVHLSLTSVLRLCSFTTASTMQHMSTTSMSLKKNIKRHWPRVRTNQIFYFFAVLCDRCLIEQWFSR